MATQFCAQCGSKLAPNADFCGDCGAQVKRSASRSKPRRTASRRAKRRQFPTKTIFILAGGVLLLLGGFLLLYNANSPAPTPGSVADYHDEEGIPYPDVPRISPAEAKTRYDAGTAIFVDVRSQGEYDTAHIANAVSLPLADLEARYQELPQNAEIITYCT